MKNTQFGEYTEKTFKRIKDKKQALIWEGPG